MNNTIILGAGLAGLGCAQALPNARIYEALDHPGGRVYSHNLNGIYFDEGAHICHSKDQQWLDLLYAQTRDVVQMSQSKVSNYWRGEWVTYPVQNHLHELPLDVKTKALTDFFATQMQFNGKKPANYYDWCLYNYGLYLLENFYAEYTRKYWRVPMQELATDWLAGRLLPSQVERIIAGALAPCEEQQATFAKFHYPAKGGIYSFFKPLFEAMDAHYNAAALEIDLSRREVAFSDGSKDQYETLASSIPLPELVRIIKDVPVAIKTASEQLRHIQLICINMLINRSNVSPYHWFYIYDNIFEASRVSAPGNLSPASVPEGKSALQAEVYRRHDESCEIDLIVEKTVEDIGRVLGFKAEEVCCVEPIYVPYSYVISNLKRADAVKTIVTWLKEHGIYPMGLSGSWQFIWSDVAYQSGVDTAHMIREKTDA